MKRTISRTLLSSLAVIALSGADVRADELAATPATRTVFAHYMVCFHNSVEFYKQEIELAQRHGIEGFALNCGAWLEKDRKTGELNVEGPYVKASERLYEAARQLDSGFKLFFSADVNGLRDLPVNMGNMVTRFYDHPNQFRHGDKRVISAWAGSPDSYRATLEKLKAEGRQVCFVPFLYSPKYKMAWSFETVLGFFRDQPHMDGLQFFACDDSVNGLLRSNAMGRRVTRHMGKIFMAGAAPAFNSPNLRDFRGMEGYGAMWEGLIRDGADWVELVTWNDYNEDSNLMPWRWPNGQERRYVDRDESYLDATGYYSAWFKAGRQPAITQDKLYFSYRNRSQALRQAWDEKGERWLDLTLEGRPFDQIHDDAGDFIYVTTFLTAAAQLTVELAGKQISIEQPAGIGHAALALAPGVPHITLTRGSGLGKPLIEVDGRKLIIGEATRENSPLGYHLLNRTWTSGAAAGPARRLAATAGQLTGGAVVESLGGRHAVRNLQSQGSGFTLPVTGLKTATYNVRVIYSNPAETEARITLSADGPTRGEQDFPYYLPLWLPPTGKGNFATTSFFWSLYSTTTRLDVQWRSGFTWGGKAVPEDDDRGSVLIEAIELVEVEAVVAPEARDTHFPELVAIPGGTFTMGTDQGKPDEGPAHRVTLAPFAIGKYKVTNAEYERFDPEHRQHRDGYSWRDREPVIYVSWVDGARYCNWLSAQAGLTPAYAEAQDEKTQAKQWQVNMDADGFRMPTEAEWEYVATGRGEGRRYPWGDAEPVPGKHGNFRGAASLTISSPLRADLEGGVMVTDAYPAGASRDGVMDLAGNVTEWCSDWFQYYTADAKSNPCNQTPSPYRAIRGSSWDYYGYPLEAVDREFNSPVYPGYTYIGLRVALPDGGRRKLAPK